MVLMLIRLAVALRISRTGEYEADHFAARNGYARQLASALAKFDWHEAARGFGKWQTHPDIPDRVRRLRKETDAC